MCVSGALSRYSWLPFCRLAYDCSLHLNIVRRYQYRTWTTVQHLHTLYGFSCLRNESQWRFEPCFKYQRTMVKTEAENKQIKRKKNIINNQSCLGPFLWNSGTVHCFSGNFLSCPKSLHWGCISSLSLVHPSQRDSQPSPSLLGPSLQHSHPIGTLTAGKSSICFSFRERTRHTFLGQTNFGIAKSGIYSASFRQEWKNFSPYCLQAFLKDVSRRILLLPIGFRGCLSVF